MLYCERVHLNKWCRVRWRVVTFICHPDNVQQWRPRFPRNVVEALLFHAPRGCGMLALSLSQKLYRGEAPVIHAFDTCECDQEHPESTRTAVGLAPYYLNRIYAAIPITGDHSKQGQILRVKRGKYIGDCVYHRSYLIGSAVLA